MNQSLINTFAAIGVAHIITYIVLFFIHYSSDIWANIEKGFFRTRIGLWFDYQYYRYRFKVRKKFPAENELYGVYAVKYLITSGKSTNPYSKKLLKLIEWMQAYDPKFNEYIIEQEYKLNNPSF